jgi:hypothetical protein
MAVHATNEIDVSWALRRLGIGNPMNVVVRWLGEPNSRSAGAGYTLLQWQRTGYHVALKFAPDGCCLGLTSQYSHRPRRV